jgi:hypothetical protein
MSVKIKRAISNYKGFKGQFTMKTILTSIPDELINGLTSKQLALVMETVNKAYHQGKSDAGLEK